MRIVIALIFINHGLMKIGSLSTPVDGVMSIVMKLLAILEPLGGVAMLLGIGTQVAAGGFIVVMVSAMIMKLSGGSGLGKVELDALLLTASLVIMTAGAGKFSLEKKK